MKSRNQTGSAHVVVIVILAVVVLGLVGYVFWNNFLKAKPSTSKTASATTSTSKTASTAGTTTTTGKNTITVPEWGVKGSISESDISGYSFNTYGDLSLTGPSLSSACEDSTGYVSRATAGEDAIFGSTATNMTAKQAYDSKADGWASAHVGDYYYFVTSPQASCQSAADATAQSDLFDGIKEFVTNLQST
jgi:hypothetical protein